jgi:hypothetical protein
VYCERFSHFLGASSVSVLTWSFNSKEPLAPQEIDELFRDVAIRTLAACVFLRKHYWFSVPFRRAVLATARYVVALVVRWA